MSDNYSVILGLLNRLKARLKNDISYQLFDKIVGEQWLKIEELEAIQIRRFNKLWKNTQTNSKFYKERGSKFNLPKEISSLSDLTSFPLLTRDDLQSFKLDILCKDNDSVYADSSGGSSGVPVYFYHNRYYDMFAEALYFIFLSWMGVSHTDKTAIFWGADRDFSEEPFKERISNRIKRFKMLNSFGVSEKSMNNYLEMLNKFKPQFIYGYSSSLELAARHINKSDKYIIRPKAIRSTAEMLYDYQREAIEQAFKCPVHNFYGSREVNNLAAECSKHEGLHIFASGRIVEIVDDQGQPLPKGEIGYIAVTDLTNYSFPFIRYINGDMASMKENPCSCGRTYPMIDSIAGRYFDILTFGGKYVHGHYFINMIYKYPDVKQFQVIQEANDKLLIRLVSPTRAINVDEFKNTIKQHIGNEVEINIQFVDEIKPLKSGKYRFTINNTLK